MARNLCIALSLLAVACMPSKGKVAGTPASSVAPSCSTDSTVIYIVDGKPVTCTSALSVPPTRIASVEVLKGPAAVALYGASAAAGVIVIWTKGDR